MKTTDMSPKAIAMRLKRVAQLRRLCLALKRAGQAEEGLDRRHDATADSYSSPDNAEPDFGNKIELNDYARKRKHINRTESTASATLWQ